MSDNPALTLRQVLAALDAGVALEAEFARQLLTKYPTDPPPTPPCGCGRCQQLEWTNTEVNG